MQSRLLRLAMCRMRSAPSTELLDLKTLGSRSLVLRRAVVATLALVARQ